MKNTILMIVAMIALAPFASADLVTVGGVIDASLLYYQPVPAQPGDVIEIWIQIENDGGNPTKAGTVTILDSGPFTVESESERIEGFPPIPSRESFLVKSKIRIAKDANEGENNLIVRIQEEGERDYIEREIAVTVTGTSSALSIVSAKTIPEELLPGETATLTVQVENIGDTKVRNVDVALDLTDLSLAPSGSSDSKAISTLRGGDMYEFTFDLVSYPGAAAQAYQLPITLSYDDETGNAKTQEETVGIVVGAKPELLVYFDDIELTTERKTGDVVIRFVNKGLSEIKLLEMEILESDEIEVTSESSIIYVGNIDEDDYESTAVSLSVGEDETVVPVVVRYKDALNRQYEEEYTLALNLQSGNGQKSNSGWVWIIILVVVAGGVWWWFRRKKNK